MARKIVEKHLDLCLDAGINHEGINAEVAKGQWEFQIFGKGSKRAADEMWVARYLLQRLCEAYEIDVEYHCKPLGDTDWNGSGMHANFSTEYMRTVGGKDYFERLMKGFEKNREDHIAVYGPDNHMRLTGKHETASIHQFSYGVADRGASIRVPHSFVNNGYKGYLEDRRPNSPRGPLPDRLADPEDDLRGEHPGRRRAAGGRVDSGPARPARTPHSRDEGPMPASDRRHRRLRALRSAREGRQVGGAPRVAVSPESVPISVPPLSHPKSSCPIPAPGCSSSRRPSPQRPRPCRR